MKVKTPHRRRRGYALMVVIVQVTLLASLWGVAYRQVVSTIRFIEFLEPGGQDATQYDLKPLTRALILLETGDPPADVYSCGITIPRYNKSPLFFVVTFTKDDSSGGGSQGGNQWTVNSHSVPDLNSWNLPTMPYSFR